MLRLKLQCKCTNGILNVFNAFSIPLIYTQVATVSTYGYFALCVVSRQYLDPADSPVIRHYNIYVPFTTILQFLLYVGWLKIAEKLLHPFGDEDNDFELNYFLGDAEIHMSWLTKFSNISPY